MSLLALAGTNSATGGYDIANSLKFESDNAEYLMAEGRSQGNQQTWTFSIWLKRTEVENGFVAQYIMSAGSDGKLSLYFRDDASYPGDQIFIYMDEGNSQKWIGRVNEAFRDTSAWYHLVFSCDTTDSTATDRTKLYINGERRTITYNDTMNVNTSTRVGDNGGKFALGARIGTPGYNFNGYMAEAVLVDGSALTPTSFGKYDPVSGIWKPKDVSDLSLGTTGFHMNFDDSSNVGAVQRGNNGGNFDKYNLSAADQATDTPTNNFCIMNKLNRTNGNIKNQEGGTKVTTDGGSGWCSMLGTMGVMRGKWYWESQRMSTGTPNDVIIGIVGSEDAYIPFNTAANYYIGNVATTSSIGYYQKTEGQEGSVINGVSMNFSSGAGDTIMFGLDMDNNKMYFGLNGTWLATNGADSIGGNPARASTLHADFDGEFVLPGVSVYQGNNMTINFGGYAAYTISTPETDANGYGTFEYEPPSGYYALCTKNLEEFG